MAQSPQPERQASAGSSSLAARREGFFDAWDAALTDPQERFVEAVRTNVPPGERVLVPAGPDLPALIDREPIPVAGGPPPGDGAVAEVERRRGGGRCVGRDPGLRDRMAA